MEETNNAFKGISDQFEVLKTVFGHLPAIPRFPGPADYFQQQEYVQQHVYPPTQILLAQYTALREAFDKITAFLGSGKHGGASKDQLASLLGARREDAIRIGAQLRGLFQRFDYRRDGPILELLALLDDLN